jgi:hypothetical protein
MSCPRIPSGVIAMCSVVAHWYYVGHETLLEVCLYATYMIFLKIIKTVVQSCTEMLCVSDTLRQWAVSNLTLVAMKLFHLRF